MSKILNNPPTSFIAVLLNSCTNVSSSNNLMLFAKMKCGKFYESPQLWIVVTMLYSILVGYLFGSFVKMETNEFDPAFGYPSSRFRFPWQDSTFYMSHNISKIYVPDNPRGAERLPPKIVQAHSDFVLHDYEGNDTVTVRESRYLLALTVGIKQQELVNKIVSKFSENFAIILFHYDGKTDEWERFEWSRRVIHISTLKQSKWWFAKRFMHPDIVIPYDYIFMWDEDLGVDNFNPHEYIKLVKKYGLEVSQPGVTSEKGLTYELTKKRNDTEVHWKVPKDVGKCTSSSSPPCAGFVEIMAPVFSRESWKCVWHMIQNDLVHGWGLDFAFWRCVQKAHERIGVVDAQWIQHLGLPSLGDQGEYVNGNQPWVGVRNRCWKELKKFENRIQGVKSQTHNPITRKKYPFKVVNNSTSTGQIKYIPSFTV